MSGAHNHALPSNGNEKSLWLALGLTTAFMIAEVIGGLLSGSLALISDAAHMFTDTAALGIALAAIRVGRRPADAILIRYTGWTWVDTVIAVAIGLWVLPRNWVNMGRAGVSGSGCRHDFGAAGMDRPGSGGYHSSRAGGLVLSMPSSS